MNKKFVSIFFVGLLFTTGFFVSSSKAHAISFNDVFNGIKDIFSGTAQTNALTVSSTIVLAPDGDINHNGQITTGDTIRFSYSIVDTTNNSYNFVTLKTNIDTKVLNGISNLQGAVSLDQSKNTVVIPNLSIDKNQMRKISFDAQVNFDKNNSSTISTQPILVDQNGNVLVTGTAQLVTANKMDIATFNKFVHITK